MCFIFLRSNLPLLQHTLDIFLKVAQNSQRRRPMKLHITRWLHCSLWPRRPEIFLSRVAFTLGNGKKSAGGEIRRGGWSPRHSSPRSALVKSRNEQGHCGVNETNCPTLETRLARDHLSEKFVCKHTLRCKFPLLPNSETIGMGDSTVPRSRL
jgi:hypothetical protein